MHEHGEKAHEHGGRGSGTFVDTQAVISHLVRRGDVFLDVGCGPGDYLRAASLLAKEIMGIDLDASSITHVKESGFRGVVADAAKKIPCESLSIDSVLLSNVLHGFVANDEAHRALGEIRRVLRPGGRLGVVEFTTQSAFGPPSALRLTSQMIDGLLLAEGFSRTGEFSVGTSNVLLIYVKE